MTIRDTIRKWLDLDDLPTKSNFAGHEAACRRRHEELLAKINDLQLHVHGRADGLLTKVNEINDRLTSTLQKANHPANFQAPELSWETVQQMALLDLKKEQE